MMNALLNNRWALTTLTRAAWYLIHKGQRVVSLSEALEGPEPDTLRCDLAWKLRSAGENLERLGARLEAHVAARASHACVSSDDVFGPLIAERSAY